jgi:hypothetical protein
VRLSLAESCTVSERERCGFDRGFYRTFCDVASMFGPKMFGPKLQKARPLA